MCCCMPVIYRPYYRLLLLHTSKLFPRRNFECPGLLRLRLRYETAGFLERLLTSFSVG